MSSRLHCDVTTDENTHLRLSSIFDSEYTSPSLDDPSSPSLYGTDVVASDHSNQSLEVSDDDDQLSAHSSDEDTENGALHALTTRLRCLFAAITWPIVPTGTLAFLALLWFLYALILDISKPCSRPIKTFAVATIFWVLYAPSHSGVRAYLFSYDRARDGPNRPLIVRRYDQIFHTMALVYVYAGITLVQTCREDEQNPANRQQADNTASIGVHSGTCDATCPNLYPALSLYVATLEVFTLSLILPLLCLPCIYVWFLRQVTADQEALVLLQERFREEEEALLSGAPTVSAGDVIDQLEAVQLVRRKNLKSLDDSNAIWVVTKDRVGCEQRKDLHGAHECVICMNDFSIIDEDEGDCHDVESGRKDEIKSGEEEIVRAINCKHLFHQRCIASWIGGRWHGSNTERSSSSWRRRRAKRTTCPLCRGNLQSEPG